MTSATEQTEVNTREVEVVMELECSSSDGVVSPATQHRQPCRNQVKVGPMLPVDAFCYARVKRWGRAGVASGAGRESGQTTTTVLVMLEQIKC